MNIESYSQPDFYHFSEDSILLSHWAKEIINNQYHKGDHFLDLCCGCGVVGIEIIREIKDANHLISVDVENDYRHHFELNQIKFIPFAKEVKFICDDILTFSKKTSEKFKWIVSNPPYFDQQSSRPSKNEKKNKARRFVNSNFIVFVSIIDQLLTLDGMAFFLTRENEGQLLNLFTKNELNLKIKQSKKMKGARLFCVVRLDK